MFEREASARRLRPQRRTAPLARRPDNLLPLVTEDVLVGRELMLDTSVYVDALQGRTSVLVDQLLQRRIVNHSTVALSELTHLLGALDPAHRQTSGVLKQLNRTIDDIPPHRLTRPSIRASGEAGMLAGLTARLTGQPKSITLLNDALIFFHAIEAGCDLLTGNLRDFDWFDQFLPSRGLLLYRRQ